MAFHSIRAPSSKQFCVKLKASEWKSETFKKRGVTESFLEPLFLAVKNSLNIKNMHEVAINKSIL